MKTHYLRLKGIAAFVLLATFNALAQVPAAGFTVSPTPICSGGTYTITDLSTNAPIAWSYTIRTGGPGPGQQTVVTAQNPVLTFTNPGAYTITLVSSNATGSSTPFAQTITVSPSPNANINPQNQTTCPGGNPLNIMVQTGPGGALSYSWSTGGTSSLISVSPSVTTTYTCVITSTATGCSSIRTATVTVSTPTASISSAPANICPGTSSTLTATGTGPGPWTYSWSTNANTSAITSSTTGVFTATVTNSQGCTAVQSYSLGTSTTLSLTVSSTPTVLCAGNTATLRVSGASSYTWSTGSSSPNATVNPTALTSYTVKGSIGTCTGTAVYTLSVSTTPTITVSSSPASVCQGGSATLTANGASSYTWLPANVNTSTIALTPSTTVNYTVRGQNPGCPVRNATVSIQVSPTPVVNIIATSNMACAGEAIGLSVFGASSYSWSTGATANLILVYPTVTAVYTATGTNSQGCSATASINLTISDCTGLAEQSSSAGALRVYPNPSQGAATIRGTVNTTVQVIDLTGALVASFELNQANGYQATISGLKSGIYFIRPGGSASPVIQKLLVD